VVDESEVKRDGSVTSFMVRAAHLEEKVTPSRNAS
jgi:hypothetical protein